jgi:L-ribulose-5-phosphate 4-epimerase
VPCTAVLDDRRIQGDYEREIGLLIVETFKGLRPSEVPMVLVACHGPFTWGPSAAEAVYHSVVLEELARMALWTLRINDRTAPIKRALVDKHFFRKHGPDATYGQNPK